MNTNEPAWLAEINARLAENVRHIPPSEWVDGYARISQDEDGGGEGVETQARNMVRYATRNELPLARITVDNDMSGADPNRPGLLYILERVESGQTRRILSRELSRLTRSRKHGGELLELFQERSVTCLFVKEQDCDLSKAHGRGSFHERVGKAAESREVNTENLVDQLRENAEAGQMHGGSRRFGYGKIVGHNPITNEDILERCALRDDEHAALREACARIMNGETQSAVSEDFNRRGILTSGAGRYNKRTGRVNDGRWSAGKLGKQLLLEAYVAYDLGEHVDADTGQRCPCLNNPEGNGIRVHNGNRHRAQWPAIFTRAEHDAMRAAMNFHVKQKDTTVPRAKNGGDYWLTGLLDCGGVWPEGTERAGEPCTDSMHGNKLIRPKRKDGSRLEQRRYKCRGRARSERTGCNAVFRDAGALEQYVMQRFFLRLEDEGLQARLDKSSNHAVRIGELQARLDKLSPKLDDAVRARTVAELDDEYDEYDKREHDGKVNTIKRELKSVEAELKKLRETNAVAALAGSGSAEEIRAQWDSRGTRWRYETVSQLIDRVIVRPANVYAAWWRDMDGKMWRFDESSVEIVWNRFVWDEPLADAA